MVPLSEMVDLISSEKPHEINRRDGYRISTLYADLKAKSKTTPLDIARYIESNVFPEIIRNIPGVILSFDGEIVDSREGKQEFIFSFLIAILGIYFILTMLFGSLLKPLRILFILPFGIVSVVMVFLFIGKSTIGFFGLIGILGMLGVVINDAIVLYVRLDRYQSSKTKSQIPSVSATRLRAILLTTITTVVGVMPTAYGIGGYDAMLSEMMLSLGWGLIGGMLVTLILVPTAYACERDVKCFVKRFTPIRWIPCLGLLFILNQPLYAKELTATSFVENALINNPTYQLILETEIGRNHSIDLSVAVSDIVSSVLFGTSYDFDSNEQIPDSSIRVSKLFYPSGTHLSVYYQNKRAGSNFKIESYGAAFSQDLLQNSFGKNNRLNLTNTQLQKQIIELQTLEAVEDYIAQLHQIYYSWAGSFKRMTLETEILKNIQVLEKEIQSKFKRRVASQNDVNRIKLQALTQQGVLIEAKTNYKKASQQISKLINDTTNFTPIVSPITTLNFNPPTKNRSLNALRLTNVVDRNKEKISSNELFPSISLDTTLFNETRSVNSTTSQSTFITSGVSIELPFPNDSKKIAYKLARSDYRQSKLNSQSSLINYEQDVFDLTEQLTQLSKQYGIEVKKRDLSLDILKQDGKDYRLGSLSLNEYIESLNRSIQSQHMALTRLIQYHKVRIEWLLLTDQLITQ